MLPMPPLRCVDAAVAVNTDDRFDLTLLLLPLLRVLTPLLLLLLLLVAIVLGGAER